LGPLARRRGLNACFNAPETGMCVAAAAGQAALISAMCGITGDHDEPMPLTCAPA
jgi:hypothetical protein